MPRIKVVVDGEEHTLSMIQHTLICNALADTYIKEERKYDRLKEKTRYHIGIGETIPAEKERERTFKMMEKIAETMKILKCP